MKLLNRLVVILIPVFSVVVLTGCAAGAATAAYSLKAQCADGLTTEGEQRIVDRAKREIMAEINSAPCR